MRVLVTGSAGHLGEALMRVLPPAGHEPVGLDIQRSPFTQHVGSIADRGFVDQCLRDIDAVVHTATLHKPHIETHSRQQFVDTNISGTLNLLEAAVGLGAGVFVFTSTTSTFGHALLPGKDEPAAWISEDVVPIPRNIYGITKLAAENLCELTHRQSGLPCLVLRTARFFPDEDDDRSARQRYSDENLKVNELLHRRADIEDVATAHVLALAKAPALGFDRLIISATTPFERDDMERLRIDASAEVQRAFPECQPEYARRGWSLPNAIDRVYVNERARVKLGWKPKYDFGFAVGQLRRGEDFRSPLARAVGTKLYHAERCADGPYPVSALPGARERSS